MTRGDRTFRIVDKPDGKSAAAKLDRAVARRNARPPLMEIGRSLAGIVFTLAVAISAFRLHLNLASAMPLLLLLIVVIALRWGFSQATVVSLAAVACLDFFFTLPIYRLTMSSPEDWISLATFETTALLVSRLSWKLRLHAQTQERQRRDMARLYGLSKAILLVDGKGSTQDQLAALMREFLEVEWVEIWIAPEGASAPSPGRESTENNTAYQAWLDGIDSDRPEQRWSRRILRLGTSPIGAMVLQGWTVEAALADAAASLVAVAIERVGAVRKENRAEAARNTEQLRTAVLDALAHGFKTPLTAIQTAGSGLLAIGQLTETQTELATIIDHEAAMLAGLTTRLLRTAALDAREIRLRASSLSLSHLLRSIVEEQDAETRRRIHISQPPASENVTADEQLIRLALAQLIDNAAKYSDVDSGIDLTFSQDASQTIIVVSNQGRPIPGEDLERIFDRFYRGSMAAHGPTGTGLGLSIAKKIAEAHGGGITVECVNDRIRFSFILNGGRNINHG